MFISYPKKLNNTEYFEFQLCNRDIKSCENELVEIQNINFNNEKSLYFDFDNYIIFNDIYGSYFNNALHSNLSEGNFDPYGLNYFSIEKTKLIVEQIQKCKPIGHEELLLFLSDAVQLNGFYILGV